MIDKVLLLIKDRGLRRLYHELLLTQDVEVVPTESVESALVLECVDRYTSVVMYPDDMSDDAVASYLLLHTQVPRLSEIYIVILTTDPESYSTHDDMLRDVVDISHIDPVRAVRQVSVHLHQGERL